MLECWNQLPAMAQARELGVALVSLGEGPPLLLEPGRASSSTFAATCSGQGLVALEGPVWSRIFLTWVFPLMQQSASTEQLQPADLFGLRPEADPEALYSDLAAAWQAELARRAGRRRPPREGSSLLRVLLRLHLRGMYHLWFGRLFQVLLSFCFPFFLNLLLRFAEDEHMPVWQGVLYAVSLFAAQGLMVLVEVNVNVGMQGVGLRIRSSMITAILRKVLILRHDSLQSFSTGTLNNMITTDVEKVRKVVRYLHILLFTAPTTIAISLVSLYKLMGVSVFISLSWMALVILLNPVLMWMMSKLEDAQQSKTDERVQKATETITAIQVVKCHAWEAPATEKVEAARRAELLAIWRLYSLYIAMEGLWDSIVPVTTAIMFASYSVLNPDTPLTAAQAFTAMNLLAIFQEPLFTIPWVLNLIVEALIAGKRLERLFFLPEVNLQSTSGIASFCTLGDRDVEEASIGRCGDVSEAGAVEFAGASFVWPRSARAVGDGGAAEQLALAEGSAAPADEFQLRDLQLHVPRGALVGIVGATGSGKTSLLHAVLGEMPQALDCEQGRVLVRRGRPLAFAPQQPWIFNGTVRQNILFGEAYEEERYAECLRSCDLEKDLAMLKSGDQTRVGERGIVLSGGQRARVCLARAAYRQSTSSIFVLDDPYSALDAHVARKVHDEAIRGLLAKKTRLVATNRLEFLGSCDLVIVLDGGRIQAVGPYDEVRKSSSALHNLLLAQGLEAAEDGPLHAGAVADHPPPARPFVRQVSSSSACSSEGLLLPGVAPDSRGQSDTKTEEHEEEEEARATGQVKKEVILYYLRNMGGPVSIGGLAFMYVAAEALQLALPIWLAHWTAASPGRADLRQFLVPYVGLSFAVVVMMASRDAMSNALGFRAARRLHSAMFAAVLRAPMSFFQDTPQGRIINRFSKDTSEIDKELVWQMIYAVVPVITVFGNFCMVGFTAFFSVIMFLPLFWLYYKLYKYYNKAALDLKRISKVLSSPVYDHFNNLCRENAISIVRAHHQVDRQCHVNNCLTVNQLLPEYSQMYAENWFSMRMDHLSCMLVLMVALCVVAGRGRFMSASSAALALTFSDECNGSIQDLIGKIAEFGMAFNCVERVMEYATTLPAEAAAVTELRPGPGWPSTGALEVRNLRLRYRPHLPLVLKCLSFQTAPGERLGVCGRTGAGKSSLILALLRIVEPDPGSQILLDGEDLLVLGLHDVRSGIAMIPQEPVLFQETLRHNCDPMGKHSDASIWAALEEAQLAPWVRQRLSTALEMEEVGTAPLATGLQQLSPLAALTSEPSGPYGLRAPTAGELESMLQVEIKEGGKNLSAGQRQMVAIARAVLRQSRLVVLDEATAAVDAATDAAIQLAVRRCFTGATTLTIAHRLQTIIDSDRVLVLENGEMVELGSPQELRLIAGGHFCSMLEESGQQRQ